MNMRTFLALLLTLLVSAPALAQDKKFFVTAVRAELRKGPSYYYEVVSRVDRNTPVTSSKRVGQWFLVKDEAGSEGWVTGYLIGDKPVEAGKESESAPTAAASNGNGAGRSNGAAPAAEEQKPEASTGAETAKPAEAAKPAGSKVLVPNKPSIPMRALPKKNGKVLKNVPSGTQMVVVGQNGPWFKVKTPKGNTGWVSGYDVDLAK
ncbi:MAG: SH3 domain-containing protein [Nitrospirae bacterium]|nr:SH3 domain-containing protein [Nitrospirota bacterium]